MKTLIVAIVMLFSLSAFAEANVHFIREAGEPDCWQGNCKIIANGNTVTQQCDTFCNFYCYKANNKIVCDGQKCWNDFDYVCRVDGQPHQVCKR